MSRWFTIPFSRPTLSKIQADALNDIAAALPTGVPLRNSVLAVLASTMAGFAHSQMGYLDYIAQQAVPFTATAEYLEAWAALKGVVRKAATSASGTVTITGLDGTSIPTGTILRRGDQVAYTTTADATMPALGSVTIPIAASLPGLTGNASGGTTLTLSSPIAGITSSAVAGSALVGGTDPETDDLLRSRMNQRYAAPPQGGAVSDYVTWALAVPGVTRAWARGNGAGPGTVVVYTMFDVAQAGNGGFPAGSTGVATLETRDIPATGDLRAVADYIYPLRPATALVYAAAPIAQPINLTLANLSSDTAAIRTGIAAAVADLYFRLGNPTGATVYPSDINAAIEAVPGLSRFTLVSPVGPIQTAIGYLPVHGSLTVI